MDPVTLQPLAAIMCTNCTELLGCSGDCVVIINRLPRRPYFSLGVLAGYPPENTSNYLSCSIGLCMKMYEQSSK